MKYGLGFSIHGNVYASVRNLHVWGNDYGISDIFQLQSVFSGVTAESNRVCGVDFHGGMYFGAYNAQESGIP
jgi:hypothetical protein